MKLATLSTSPPRALPATLSLVDAPRGIKTPLKKALKDKGVRLVEGPADAVIVATGLSTDAPPAEAGWQALSHLRDAYQAGARTLILLQDTGGAFKAGPSQGWQGGYSGLAKTAAQEWTSADLQVVDVSAATLSMGRSCRGDCKSLTNRCTGSGRLTDRRAARPKPRPSPFLPRKQIIRLRKTFGWSQVAHAG